MSRVHVVPLFPSTDRSRVLTSIKPTRVETLLNGSRLRWKLNNSIALNDR